jgi:hypothetical protein
MRNKGVVSERRQVWGDCVPCRSAPIRTAPYGGRETGLHLTLSLRLLLAALDGAIDDGRLVLARAFPLQIWLAERAVVSEPVSGANSLVSGI